MSQFGSVPLIQPQDLFVQSSTQQTVLGAYAETSDGRGYRYAKAGATSLVAGKLQQGPAEDTSNYENLAVTATALGATSVVTTTTATVTANALAGGLLVVTVTPGAGYAYRISGNTAATGAAFTITLEDPIQFPLTTTSRIDLYPSVYNGIVVNPTTATAAVVGVTVGTVTLSQFAWVQTHGPACVLADGAIVVGQSVYASTAVVGAVTSRAASQSGTAAFVGLAVTGIADTEYGQVLLMLD